jgi:hypothetical protein
MAEDRIGAITQQSIEAIALLWQPLQQNSFSGAWPTLSPGNN